MATDHPCRPSPETLRQLSGNFQAGLPENHMLLLGRKSAMERVANFLLEMDRRVAVAGMMALPMCRRDIGDYLGLTLETVSRALSQLHGEGSDFPARVGSSFATGRASNGFLLP